MGGEGECIKKAGDPSSGISVNKIIFGPFRLVEGAMDVKGSMIEVSNHF